MENKDVILKVLDRYPVSTSKEIAKFAWQVHGVDMSASAISGQLRSLERKAIVASSKNERGTSVYWLV